MRRRLSAKAKAKQQPSQIQETKGVTVQVGMQSQKQKVAQRAQQATQIFQSKILELDDENLQSLIIVIETLAKLAGRRRSPNKEPSVTREPSTTNSLSLQEQLLKDIEEDEEISEDVKQVLSEMVREPSLIKRDDKQIAKQMRAQTENERQLLKEAIEVVVNTANANSRASQKQPTDERLSQLQAELNTQSISDELKDACRRVLPFCEFNCNGELCASDIDTSSLRLEIVDASPSQQNAITEARKIIETATEKLLAKPELPTKPRQNASTKRNEEPRQKSNQLTAPPYAISILRNQTNESESIGFVVKEEVPKVHKPEVCLTSIDLALIELEEAIGKRRDTLLIVTNEILKVQMQYFRRSVELMATETESDKIVDLLTECIVPRMTKESLAQSIKEDAKRAKSFATTVSRAVKGKSIKTDFGIIALEQFFSASRMWDAQNKQIHPNVIKNAIAKLIKQESPSKPLSDKRLAELLVENNAVKMIVRETVKKYRKDLGIPDSRKRRAK